VIRFVPDNLAEAFLRPLAMATPNGGVYVEMMAPDLRFAFLAGAMLITFLSTSGRQAARKAAIMPLTLYGAVAFALWLATSGNGRYFIPGLLLAGPLLIGWLYRSNSSRSMKMTLGGLMLAVQGWAVWQTSPWDAWSQTAWIAPNGFQVAVDERARTEPSTYVTLTSPTYSIVAPQFSHDARWINLDALQGHRRPTEEEAVRNLLAVSRQIVLVTPAESPQAQSVSDGELVTAFNRRLQNEGLRIARFSDCRMLPSASMRPRVPIRLTRGNDVVELGPVGFWLCDMKYDASAVRPPSQMPELLASLVGEIEHACPRFFPLGRGQRTVLESMTIVNYPNSDMKLYADNSGDISYLYYRALNPVQIASNGVLRRDIEAWCDNVQGRSGVPWARGL
jgi:hypothetical protein